MTDHELGVFRLYSFKVHGALDYGVAAASSLFQALLGIDDSAAKAYFYGQGGAETMTAGVSNYDDNSGSQQNLQWVGQRLTKRDEWESRFKPRRSA